MSKGFHRLAPDVPWSNSTSPLASIGRITVPVRDAPVYVGVDVAGPDSDMTVFTTGPGTMSRDEAKLSGFTGDQCSVCGSMKMQIAGHCQVCAECGTTTGCS